MSKPILIIEHDPTDPPGRVVDWLDEGGFEHDIVRPHAAEALPVDLSAYAGTIMLGGHMSAVSDEGFAWRQESFDFVRRAISGDHPLLGVCLGGQVMAQAMGGLVERGAHGREVGAMLVGRRDISYRDRLFGDLPMAPDVLQFHGEAITELPPGAVLLLNGPVYDNQAFRVGTSAWGLQFHIETTPEVFAQWAESSRESLERAGMDVDTLIDRAVAVHPDVAEVWAPFVRKFAGLAASAPAS